jgi:hypothetical protein
MIDSDNRVAFEHAHESLAIADELNDKRRQAHVLTVLGQLNDRAGRFSEAIGD